MRAVTPWLAGTTFDGLWSRIFPCILTDYGCFPPVLTTKVQVCGAFPASNPGMPQSGLTVQVPPVFSEKPLTGFIRIWYDPCEAVAEILASFLTSLCSLPTGKGQLCQVVSGLL